MASLRVLAFDHEGRPIQFDTWLDDLQLYLLSDSKDSVSLFDLASGAATAPPTTAYSATRSHTTLTPLPAPVPVRLADPSRGPVVARLSTLIPCLAVPSGSLSGLHLPSFSTILVSTAALQDAMVTTTTPRGSSLYTLATEPPPVAAFAQVSVSGQRAAPQFSSFPPTTAPLQTLHMDV
ncbi:unnamed protein product, partial [Closterium sp. NIES-53]